jgi:hypothetical protein
MKLSYPQFSLAGAPIGTGPVPIWKGWVQPIQNRESLEQLLDDVYHNCPASITFSLPRQLEFPFH